LISSSVELSFLSYQGDDTNFQHPLSTRLSIVITSKRIWIVQKIGFATYEERFPVIPITVHSKKC